VDEEEEDVRRTPDKENAWRRLTKEEDAWRAVDEEEEDVRRTADKENAWRCMTEEEDVWRAVDEQYVACRGGRRGRGRRRRAAHGGQKCAQRSAELENTRRAVNEADPRRVADEGRLRDSCTTRLAIIARRPFAIICFLLLLMTRVTTADSDYYADDGTGDGGWTGAPSHLPTTLSERLATKNCYDPSGISCTCSGENVFSNGLYENDLSGTIPPELSACTDVTTLCVYCLSLTHFH
jgi:hypothetical protein